MNKYDEILLIARNNNGIITTKMLSEINIARQYIKNLVNHGELFKVSRGIYSLPETWDDEFKNLQLQFRKGFFSKETALFLHDMSDLTPASFSMTFPLSYNLTNVKNAGIIANVANENIYNLGIEKIKTPFGNEILVYNIEKTLCDILRPRSGVEISVITNAFKNYVNSKNKNIPRLSEYTKILKVDQKIRAYLQVLL